MIHTCGYILNNWLICLQLINEFDWAIQKCLTKYTVVCHTLKYRQVWLPRGKKQEKKNTGRNQSISCYTEIQYRKVPKINRSTKYIQVPSNNYFLNSHHAMGKI